MKTMFYCVYLVIGFVVVAVLNGCDDTQYVDTYKGPAVEPFVRCADDSDCSYNELCVDYPEATSDIQSTGLDASVSVCVVGCKVGTKENAYGDIVRDVSTDTCARRNPAYYCDKETLRCKPEKPDFVDDDDATDDDDDNANDDDDDEVGDDDDTGDDDDNDNTGDDDDDVVIPQNDITITCQYEGTLRGDYYGQASWIADNSEGWAKDWNNQMTENEVSFRIDMDSFKGPKVSVDLTRGEVDDDGDGGEWVGWKSDLYQPDDCYYVEEGGTDRVEMRIGDFKAGSGTPLSFPSAD